PRHLHSFPTRRSSDLDGLRAVHERHGLILQSKKPLRRDLLPIQIARQFECMLECPQAFGVLDELNGTGEIAPAIGLEFLQFDFRSEEHTSELQSRENL